MTIQSRPYVDGDLPHIQAALAGWIRSAGACGYCHIGYIPHMIYETLRGRHPVAGLVQVWEDRASIAGIAINGLFDTTFLVFASPRYRGTDAELEMLRVAYQTTRRHVTEAEGERASVNTDAHSDDTTRIALLARLGFTRHRVWDNITERSLSEPIPDVGLPHGFTLRPATMDDCMQLAGLRNDAFDDDWAPDAFRDEVMRKPGYRPEWEIVVEAAGGQIAASTVTRLDEANRVGLFEPVGTRREYRRRGLARAMMLHSAREMQRLGMETARVQHDAANRAARGLYHGLGFRKRCETVGYRRA
jgi:ribosomal protein S18 acetylase RimI-like enzyme